LIQERLPDRELQILAAGSSDRPEGNERTDWVNWVEQTWRLKRARHTFFKKNNGASNSS
jgi:hypothetical protein